MPQPSWSPSTTQQLRKLVAAPYLPPNDWTPRLDAYFASPLALCARRVSSAASRLLGSTSLRFALHGWQRVIVPGHGPVTDLAQARKDTRDYLVSVYKCQVIEIQLKNRKKTMRNPVQDGTIMILKH
ncbi:hypothetical protein [Thiolapillus sp.]|uniref:hypothetical protein n=1 Tax=Thiolapillus sp. TaxID=2017437 RepID=UPI003AF573B0